ncbi:paraneoplastic antigen-like protein 8A [Peromyscus californicus insignis]|uniref:paraneoplastic antigen-like protein 8A n=1 Tax=Peromyscus californicus insignis TaxID=564181 RepID=UPI0022A6C5D0|nr:paraneoplastic antigen-like protein 8A [Peromyscus californicus insignis]
MSEPRAMSLLEDWCKGMGLDIHRSLLVTGIPEHCGHAEIEETLNGILLPLGTYRVLNKIFLRQENVKAALIEVSEGVNLSSIPREFPGRGGVWKVVCRDPTQDAEFLKNLNEFLDAEGRTWEDVVRLLRLNPSFPNPNQPPPNWAEAVGLLLGAVVQVIFYKDSEIRSREEEARATEEATEAELMATRASTARRVKKEPGLGAEVGSACKMEDRGDPPKPLVRRAGGKIRSRRRKQKKNPKQEPIFWRKPQGNNYNNRVGAEPAAAQSSEIPESAKSNKKPIVKQEETVWKKKRIWKEDPNDLPHSTLPGAESPENLEDSDQDGGPESPPKKKAATWPSNKIPAPVRKKKKMSLASLSYVLVDSEGTKNKPGIPKKGSGSRRAMSAQRAPQGPQPDDASPSTSRARKMKPGGFPRVSKDPRQL